MPASLEISREGRLLHVALNRPEKRNALDAELCRNLVRALDAAEADPTVGAILITGNGKSFCAGMDLSEVLAADTSLGDLHESLFSAGVRLVKPIVAAVHGAALAGGTGLAANCHVVLASEDASFGLTEIRLGLWPFVIFRSVVLAVGERRATELALTGRIFGAVEAAQMGLVHHVVPRAELEEQARDLAGDLADASGTALRSGLGCIQQIRGKTWEEAGRICRALRLEIFQSADFQEGVRAFHEKRPPVWPSTKV